MTTVNDDDRKRNVANRTSRTKSIKGQKTLFELFPTTFVRRNVGASVELLSGDQPTEINQTTSASANDHMQDSLVDEHPLTPPSKTIADRSNPLLTPKQRLQTPVFQDMSVTEQSPTNASFTRADDSGSDVLPTLIDDLTTHEGSQEAPIVIDSSPVNRRSETVPEVKKPIHPFFAPRTKTQSIAKDTRSRKKNLHVPYPDKESQRVTGLQTIFPSRTCPFARKPTSVVPTTSLPPQDVSSSVFVSLLERDEVIDSSSNYHTPPTNPRSHVLSINQSHIDEHPAVARVVNATSSNTSASSGQLWTETWRPRCAKEVLGNETSAIYLRNWLHSLALELNPSSIPPELAGNKRKRKKKRPNVIRTVARKKSRRDNLDGFIAEDDEDVVYHDMGAFPDEYEDSLPDDVPVTLPGKEIKNTILLAGPPGSGKTAAVFACAEELGWEVFEVYPGIGKRNGASVENLVGEVGKNHLVRKIANPAGHQTIKTLFSNTVNSSEGNVVEQRSMTDCGKGSPGSDDDVFRNEGTQQTFRQSLILLEEVDILFKDDVNFWPAVTSFIGECRRPVICTCNDVSLVPTEGLPLQQILYFEPCSPDVAVSYLQGLCCAEGYVVHPDILRQLYTETYELSSADIPDDTNTTITSVELPVPDLRKAIHNLQFSEGRWLFDNDSSLEPAQEVLHGSVVDWTHGFPPGDRKRSNSNIEDNESYTRRESEKGKNIQVLQALGRQADIFSYVDRYLLLPQSRRKEALAFASIQVSGDDENGYPILYGGMTNYDYDNAMYDFHDRDMEMASVAIRLARGDEATGLARGRLSIDGDGKQQRWPPFRARVVVDYQTLIGEYMVQSGLVDGATARRGCLAIDYVPYIRFMAETDELLEQKLQEAEGRESGMGRTTRNSQRTKYPARVSELAREGRRVLGMYCTS